MFENGFQRIGVMPLTIFFLYWLTNQLGMFNDLSRSRSNSTFNPLLTSPNAIKIQWKTMYCIAGIQVIGRWYLAPPLFRYSK